ncbi:SpaA isopeptide-forming pilin-related protein [Frisingicoccus caecimuris]|uniref:LPXTG-motif cell wall-anchored protein n=1 Tax=Frisingicoccus caecimuris TaxID=1796636 RepID=A0A4R2LK09_9FIRM|nr:SpaA isopeptide-forming pilin-related protein [Frisingicoccus caecimuris]MCR1919623.1 SpaA isopeptide-forming pilin-related protein [Frisingicoccus caecimuris]TCO83576.1 LPXTG-motif cell wall-anchored protein [Frisingicoccus caecimuris]
MRRTGHLRRLVSGFLAGMTLLSTVLSPMTAYAAEPKAEEKPPLYEEVKDLLDEDEVVKAKDYEITVGSEFDVACDFTGLEIKDDKKVKVTFEEAKNGEGKDFALDHADSYKAVYYVEPVNEAHPKYQISRNLIVKEAETEVQAASEGGGEDAGSGGTEEAADDGEADSQTLSVEENETAETETSVETETVTETETETVESSEVLPEEDLDAALEESEDQETVDPETGLSVSDVLEQGEEQGIDMLSLEEGETVQFQAQALFASARSTTSVSVTRGAYYYYADYGLGSYLTAPYTVKFGDITATAYCVQPSKPGPGDGTYTITKLSDGKTLAKVCYYGTKASGDEGFFAEKHPDFSTGKRFIITHLAAAYANGSSDAFSGTNSTGQALAMELYNYCVSQPEIPDVAMSFSNAKVKAYIDGNSQRTEEITFKADVLQTITMKLPSGVKFHNVSTGKTSAAGASVEVSGGTKFYLSAPLTQAEDVSGSWSVTMKGSITKDYSAYKITTGSSTQDLALVFGEGVTDEKYVDFSVEWVKMAKIEIVKKDAGSNAKVAGAVYGIYSDEAGKNLIAKMPATDANGASSITIEKTQNTVYLKEISVPNGYVLDTKAYGINLIIGGTTKKDVTDKEQFADLTVYKEGEVLTGASVTDSGVVFQYTKQRLKGAVYNVYAGADIKAADGRVIFQKGALVKEGLTTGEDGSATLKNLHLGTYVVTETKAPADYVCKGESKTVTLSYAGQNVEVAVGNVTFANDRQKASVSVLKQDDTTKNPLSGGIYGLYAAEDIADVSGNVVVRKDTLIEKATTGNDGNAVYQADLPINHSYYVKELQAPVNYFRNSEDVFSFRFQYTNDKQASVSFTHTFENERVNATIHLVKKDKETGRESQGDAAFEGAVYGVYARENIIHPDGKTGILYKAGSQVATMTVDKKGDASVEDLYLGKYYVKEITPPTGYLIDEGEYDLECSYEGDLVKTVERSTESSEQVMKQPFQVIKAANNGKTDADLLKGAGFTAYLKSSLKTNPDGSYDFASAKPVVLTADGKTEMFTDAKGYACSIPLPYGTYLVKETTTPHNYKPVDDFIVTISENHPDEPQIWRILLDDEFKAKLKIVKKDDETKRPVLVAGTEFKIYDLDHKKYVEQVTTYPITVTHKSYFTDSQGYLILPNNLSIGHYRIEEVTAPDGYTLNQNYVEIAVDSNTAYQMDSVSGDVVIEVDYENHPVKGKLAVYKKGEMLAGFNKDFIYEEQFLKDAVFGVYAAEDIYSPDYQKDADGNRIVVYAKDTLVTTITTGEDGMAVAENLPLGAYRVVEKTAPEGFVLNPEAAEVVFVYEGQDTPVVEQEVTVGDERQKVAVTVEKQDAENGAVVAGAVFGIYNKEDITADGKVIVEADTLLQEMTSDEKGQAGCTLDLPLGSYYVKELKAPAGFVSSNEVLDFDASYQGQDVETVVLKAVKKNQPTTVEITKSDITTGTELDGASLKVLDKDGNVVDEWTSVKDAPHVIKRLVAGETYTLREEFAPYGYLKATDITFTVEDNGDVQKVEMKDEVPTGLLIINKKGEFLDKVTLLDNAKGTVEHLFEYITGSLTEVTFNVYAAEDIKAADGVSEDYFQADELVGTITTDTNGIAQLGDLPVGKYYVKEAETAHGYVLDGEPKFVDLSYRDQDTPVVTYDEAWQNNRQKVKVTVLKKEKDTERVLAGGIFGLFTREDIKNADGDVLLEADTLIELKTSDENGQITFTADLPVDGNYYVKELYAPDGFVATNEEQDFTFEYAGAEQAEVSYDFTFENEATTVELTKSDLTTGDELPGAHLKVTDEDGNVVDEWVSTEEAHVIKELVVGKTYTMTETKPADGYVTAESIEFTIENTAEIQKHEMKDDVTKVQISKTDITGDQEIPGAKLTILDENDQVVESWTSTEEPHYVEKLPIGKYTLREEQAPKGFILTADVSFEVKDTGEIQTVVMKDDTAKGKVILNKTDKETGEPLKGVEFELRDSKGKVLETLKTDAAGHAESSLYEIADYKDGKFAGEKKYYLVETKTLDGYTLDKTEHEVVFAYKDDSTPIVEVTFDLTNDKPEVPQTSEGTPGTPSAGNPKTGDETNLWLPVVLLAISVSGIAGLLAARRKRKRK